MRIREFDLYVPNFRDRTGAGDPTVLRITAPAHVWMPKQFHLYGLRRFENATLACAVALADDLPVPNGEARSTFLDVGANIGIYAALIDKFFSDRLSVVAFEPFPETRRVAESLANANGLSHEIRAEAVAGGPGTSTLFLSSVSDTSHSLRWKESSSSGDTIEVRTVSIDSLCGEQGLRLAFAKLDTEGNEPQIFSGAVETIERDRPSFIVEILSSAAANEIHEIFAPFDYYYYPISNAESWEPVTELERRTERNWLLSPRKLDDSFQQRRVDYTHRLHSCHAPLRGTGRGLQADAVQSGEIVLHAGDSREIFIGSSHGQLLVSSNHAGVAGAFSFVCRSDKASARHLYGAAEMLGVCKNDEEPPEGRVSIRFEPDGWITFHNRTGANRTVSYTIVGSLPNRA